MCQGFLGKNFELLKQHLTRVSISPKMHQAKNLANRPNGLLEDA